MAGAALAVWVMLGSPGRRAPLVRDVERALRDRGITVETVLRDRDLTVLHLYLEPARSRQVADELTASPPAGAKPVPGQPAPQPESPSHGLLAFERDGEKVVLQFLPRREKDPALPKTPKTAPSPPRRRVVLALCIDDLGQSMEAVEWFERQRRPLNAAVLPFLPRSEETARRLNAAGVEVLCHLPMQPENAAAHPPGPGAILFGTGEPDLKAAVERALDAVPHAKGFNNHMGSALTADRLYMRWVLEAARGRASYFLDSRTSAATVAEAVGAEMGFPVLRRHVFLDDVAEPAYIRRQIGEALDKASRQPYAIAIGHPSRATLKTLAEELPRLEKRANLVRLTDLLEPAP